MLSSKFVYAGPEFSTYDKFVPAPYFRKEFTLAAIPAACEVTACGLGFYDIFINGQKITKGLLAPYISNPDDIMYYDAYDLLPYVKEGKNVLGFQLGNGFLNAPGGQIWDFDQAAFRGAPRVAFALEIKDENGASTLMEADETVKTAPSPILFDDERCGCFYDANKEIPGWNLPEFDASSWADAKPAPLCKGEARLCEADPIVKVKELKPVSVTRGTLAKYEWRDDVVSSSSTLPSKETVGYLYDFGVNTAGIIRLEIEGKKGQQIDIQFGEYIDADGNLNYSNINFYPLGFAQRDIYILKGEGKEVFEPQFTYHGARYAFVLGLTEEQATQDLLTFIVCNSDLQERGNFSCSDPVANRLQEMTRISDLANFYYFPTDCPHREKNGWTGDANASAEHMLLNLSVEKSLREWMRNVCAAQDDKGAIPGIVPTGGWGFAWGNGPAWDAILTYIPYFVYRFRGDRQILEEVADTLDRYDHYLATRRDRHGLIAIGLGDWVPVTVIKSPLEFTDSVISMNILKKAAFIFNELGQTDRADYALQLRCELKAAVRKHLVDLNTMTAIGCCQTSQALGIYFDVFEPAEKPMALKVLKDVIAKAGGHFDCGFLGMRVLFRVLADMGEADLAYDMITRPDYPSYGNFVERKLTALPEDFRKADAFPNSLNHHFFGDISAFFMEYVAGLRINPYDEDPCEVNVQPCFIQKLDHAEAYYDTVGGKIKVLWERTSRPGEIKLTVEKADAVFGRIQLPNGYRFAAAEPGYAHNVSAQTSFCDLRSGEYLIMAE